MQADDEETKGDIEEARSNRMNKSGDDCVKLISNDGMEFVVPVKILCQSPTLAKMLDGRFKESTKIMKANDK